MSREVMLPDWLIAALRKRRVARPNDVWVFPSATGMPACKSQLLYMLQAVAKRARVGGRVDLHKFRSTYASLLNKSGKVTVEEISGPPRARRHRDHALLPGADESEYGQGQTAKQRCVCQSGVKINLSGSPNPQEAGTWKPLKRNLRPWIVP